MAHVILAGLLTLAVVAQAYLLPPAGSITVGGKLGKYANLSTALNDTSSSIYFVYPG
jgi:pectinesterase